MRLGASASEAPDTSIELVLSASQTRIVLERAGEGRSLSALLSGLNAGKPAGGRIYREIAEADRKLSSSLLSGLLVLASFPQDGSAIGNSELAHMLNMNASTAHRYVTTLLAAGLLEKDSATRRYRLPERYSNPGAPK